MIEDELLMAAPIAPVHPTECAQLCMQSGEKANPFTVLKGKSMELDRQMFKQPQQPLLQRLNRLLVLHFK